MAVGSVFMTPSGIQKLAQQRKDFQRRLEQALEVLQEDARSSNEDATAMALSEKLYVEEQLRQIEGQLQKAQILPAPRKNEVGLGSTVELETKDGTRSFTLVDTLEADPAANFISPESPLGRSLMGHHAGDSIDMDLPTGHFNFRLSHIR